MSSDFSVTHDDVDAIAAWTVVRAARELARRLDEELAPLGLTPVGFGALVQLAAAEELNQAELARAVGVRAQSMGSLVEALATRGLVARGAAPGRGRASRLHLTDAGRELLAAAWPRVRASNAWFPDGGETVARTLRPFTTHGTVSARADGLA
ncbi:MarR family transcriptional regulator [Curtobacterium sp. Csp2]|uniref:MarR family winged helix-turn-helix transcriptional regulator n=1 Tax=Curtobacterium sp. Csp2 TaxID=2495430 RepID=UPI0015805F53|nr:MarR family transcriptional regulator [Curtobacterium sp. Csp2]QKS15228.1 MarR family transcriptional regulator [Curtobacterium sp. Csp2]QKS15242.1 MarR family transcriptional regulator [Curtobacterium sp. Csp2]